MAMTLSLSYYSCKRCESIVCANDMPQLKLGNFSYHDIPYTDTIWIIYHSNPEDTIVSRIEQITRSSNNKLAYNIDMRNNVTIVMPGLNKHYELTDFNYIQRDCGGCGKPYMAFTGCILNGQPTGPEVILNK
jgi:hypothetical protein